MTAVGVEPKTSGNNAAIRPFRVEIPDDALEDLRRRIAARGCPPRSSSTDRSQGVQLATIQALSRYWLNDYDWRMCEARLNALPQYKTEIDGADIHFIHVKSRHENALAAGHHSRVAGLDHRDARDHRPAHRPDRSRRTGGGRVPPGAAVPPRIRLLGRAIRARLGRRPLRAGVGQADAPSRLHPLRRPGRRRRAPMSPTRWAARRQKG